MCVGILVLNAQSQTMLEKKQMESSKLKQFSQIMPVLKTFKFQLARVEGAQ